MGKRLDPNITNKDMLNGIRNAASAEYKDKMPIMTEDSIEAYKMFQSKLDEYPTAKNEFLSTLVNKVSRTEYYSRLYENKLKMLKKAPIDGGYAIEELFVYEAEAKGFYGESSHWNDENGGETINQPAGADKYFEQTLPDIKKLYITTNYRHFFPTSVSDAQLKAAFRSSNGLYGLVNQIIASCQNGAEQREYKDMITLLKAVAAQKRIRTDGKGLIVAPMTSNVGDDIPKTMAAHSEITSLSSLRKKQGVLQAMYKYNVDNPDLMLANTAPEGKKVSASIRALAERMTFVSTKYNMAGVNTFCRKEDLVFLTTPEMKASMDVEVLADAFNMDKTDFNVRVITVDELPTVWFKGNKITALGAGMADVGFYYKTTVEEAPHTINTITQKCYGILMDKNFIQALDELNEFRQFENGRALSTNMWLHRWGALANCYFANCVALFNTAGYQEVSPENEK